MNDIEPLFIRVVDKSIAEDTSGELKGLLSQIESEMLQELPHAFSGRSEECYARYKLVKKYGNSAGPIAVDLAAVIQYDKTYYDKLVGNIGPLLEIMAVLGPDTRKISSSSEVADAS